MCGSMSRGSKFKPSTSKSFATENLFHRAEINSSYFKKSAKPSPGLSSSDRKLYSNASTSSILMFNHVDSINSPRRPLLQKSESIQSFMSSQTPQALSDRPKVHKKSYFLLHDSETANPNSVHQSPGLKTPTNHPFGQKVGLQQSALSVSRLMRQKASLQLRRERSGEVVKSGLGRVQGSAAIEAGRSLDEASGDRPGDDLADEGLNNEINANHEVHDGPRTMNSPGVTKLGLQDANTTKHLDKSCLSQSEPTSALARVSKAGLAMQLKKVFHEKASIAAENLKSAKKELLQSVGSCSLEVIPTFRLDVSRSQPELEQSLPKYKRMEQSFTQPSILQKFVHPDFGPVRLCHTHRRDTGVLGHQLDQRTQSREDLLQREVHSTKETFPDSLSQIKDTQEEQWKPKTSYFRNLLEKQVSFMEHVPVSIGVASFADGPSASALRGPAAVSEMLKTGNFGKKHDSLARIGDSNRLMNDEGLPPHTTRSSPSLQEVLSKALGMNDMLRDLLAWGVKLEKPPQVHHSFTMKEVPKFPTTSIGLNKHQSSNITIANGVADQQGQPATQQVSRNLASVFASQIVQNAKPKPLISPLYSTLWDQQDPEPDSRVVIESSHLSPTQDVQPGPSQQDHTLETLDELLTQNLQLLSTFSKHRTEGSQTPNPKCSSVQEHLAPSWKS